MKKAKRFSNSLVVIPLISALLTGCGSSSGSNHAIVDSQEPAAAETTATEAPAADSGTAQAAEPKAADTTIDEQVIFDMDGVKMTALSYQTGGWTGDSIKVLIENNSGKKVGVGCDALIVNDYMISTLFSSIIDDGMKANETIDLYNSQLSAAGIANVGKIEVKFHLFDPDSFMTTTTGETYTIQTNHFDDMDLTPNDAGKELYNENGVRIVGKYVNDDTIWGNAIVLYLENNTDQNIVVQCDTMAINGFMMTPFFSSEIYANKRAISEITLMSSELEQNGIEKVQDVQVTFNILNAETFSNIATSEPIQFSVE